MSADEFIIQGIVARRGPEVATRYAQQTLQVYRRAVLNPAHYASTAEYRRAFIMSYLSYKRYLQAHVGLRAAAGPSLEKPNPLLKKNPTEDSADERERRIDEELAGTFPASDPPSWTLGGSLVSLTQDRVRHAGR